MKAVTAVQDHDVLFQILQTDWAYGNFVKSI